MKIILAIALTAVLTSCSDNVEQQNVLDLPGESFAEISREKDNNQVGIGAYYEYEKLIVDLKKALHSEKYFDGEFNSIKGADLTNAIKAYQRDYELEMNGNIDEELLINLGIDPQRWRNIPAAGYSE